MKIPGYRLGREVSSDSDSSVYNALHEKTSITMSVRVFNQTLSANREFCNQLKRVVQPLIDQTLGVMVPVRKVVADEKHCYIVTDFFSASQHLESTLTSSTEQLLEHALQIASTLELLRQRKLVHGGVKTANIAFNDQSQVMLGFIALHRTLPAVAQHAKPARDVSDAMYLAPETRLQGLTPATDFYALGSVLFELIYRQYPFSANDLVQLEKQKNSLDINFPSGEHIDLNPLFVRLLNPDPQRRISNAEQFHHWVGKCGYHINRPQYSTGSERKFSSPKPENTASKTLTAIDRKKLYAAGIAATVLLVVVLFFVLPGSQQTTTATDTVQAPASTTQNSDASATQQAQVNKKVQTADSAEALYQQAQDNMSRGNYGSALISVNNAIRENPEHAQARLLKQKIEIELEARAIINKAETLISQGKLTKPRGENAYQTYQHLATVLPSGDGRALAGYAKIAAIYFNLAKKEFSNNNIEGAKSYIDNGYQVMPNYGPLKELELGIQQHQQRLAEKKRQQKIRAENARKEKQARLEQQRRQQEQQQKRDRELLAQQQKQQQLERQKINSLLAEAKNNLNTNTLSLSSITRAKKEYNRIYDQYPQNSLVAKLKMEILDAYGILAISQKNANQYNSALITLKQGLTMDADNENLKLIQNEINTLIALQNQPSESPAQKPAVNNIPVPVIGTF